MNNQNSNLSIPEKILNYTMNNVRKTIIYSALSLTTLIGISQSIYTIPTDSQGVIRTFGAYTRTSEPGIHLKFPFGIEKVNKIPVKKVQREEFGFRTIKAGIESQFATEENSPKELADAFRKEYLMLTGDLNMADIEFLVQYKIKNPVEYLFNIREPTETIRDCSLAVMKQIIGDGSVDEAITIGRSENEEQVKNKLQDILDKYKIGIDIVTIKLQSCNPPKRVRPSFNEVNRALQEKEKRINEARQEYNRVIPRAKGEAEQTIMNAEGYAIERVNQSRGDAQKFTTIREEYEKSPKITRQRLYFETMEKILPGLEKTLVEQKGAEGGILLHLNIDKNSEVEK